MLVNGLGRLPRNNAARADCAETDLTCMEGSLNSN